MRKGVEACVALAVFAAAANGASLEECIDAAIAGNPDYAAASHRVEAARAAVTEARSQWYPQLTASGQYTRTDNPPQAFFMRLNQRSASFEQDFNQPDDTDNLRLSVSAKQRLIDGGRRSLGIRAATLGSETTATLRDAALNELVYEVSRAYYNVLQVRAMTAVREETVASIEESLRIANERVRAGVVTRTDALNLEVRLAEAKEDLVRIRHALRLAVAALNTAIGREMSPAASRETDSSALPAPPAFEPASEAVEARPELRAARLNTLVQETLSRQARREYVPTVSLFGSMDWDSDVSSDFERSYLAGIVAEWDVFTGFRRGAAIDAASSRHLAARAEERALFNALLLDLQQAEAQVAEAWERLAVARQSVASAEEALRITREQYGQGAADLSELLTAQVGLTATRTRNAAAHYDYMIALANLERASGRPSGSVREESK